MGVPRPGGSKTGWRRKYPIRSVSDRRTGEDDGPVAATGEVPTRTVIGTLE